MTQDLKVSPMMLWWAILLWVHGQLVPTMDMCFALLVYLTGQRLGTQFEVS